MIYLTNLGLIKLKERRMLNANLLLIILIIYKLLKNHYQQTRSVIYVSLLIITANIIVIARAFPLEDFYRFPLILRLVLIEGIIGFLPVPFMLMFLQSMILKTIKPNLFQVILFIPFILSLINLIPYFSLPIQEKIQISTNVNTSLREDYYLLISLPTLHKISHIYNPIFGFLTVLYLVTILLQKWSKLSKKTYSILYQIFIIFTVNLIAISYISYYKILQFDDFYSDNTLGMMSMILPVSILLFPNLIYDVSVNSDLNILFKIFNRFTKNKENSDSINLGLEDETTRILTYLHDEKPYLNARFSTHDIVSTLNIPQKTVRDCFNQTIKVPFPKMRNQLRVAYAIDMFKKNTHLTISIEGIAAESGFNNRATFYQAFREVTNTTPVQWIKENCDYSFVQ